MRRLRRALRGKTSKPAVSPRQTSSTTASNTNWHVAHMRTLRFSPEEVTALLTPSGIRFSEADVLAPLIASDEPTLPERRRMQRLDIMNHVTNIVLPKVQQPATAFGLDLRLPFLDHHLVDWAIAKPIDEREYTERKPALRDYLRNHVPDDIVNLPKHGLNPSWSEQLPVEDTLRQLRDGYWARQGYWTRELEKHVRVNEGGWRGRLWSLYLLERWAAHWLR
jgi:asparagine synthase (glutamine-hydrolysing)